MVTLPPQVEDYPRILDGTQTVESYLLSKVHYELKHRGKVRDTYESRLINHYYVVVASDRISVLDFVLPVLIPGKGEILTALTHFWLTRVLVGVDHHLIGHYGDLYLDPDIPLTRCLTVTPHRILPFELIYRAHLGGSVWQEYEEKGTTAGQPVSEGLKKWNKLPEPLFTPSTKAETGHDQNVTVGQFEEQTGENGIEIALAGQQIFQRLYNYAWERGIAILDTKMEFSTTGVLCDEIGTPDSSRFTTVLDWEQAQKDGRDPIFYDKEPLRIWARQVETPWGVGYNRLDPENSEHVAFVHSVQVPPELVEQTARRYQEIFEMLIGMPLGHYQREKMGLG